MNISPDRPQKKQRTGNESGVFKLPSGPLNFNQVRSRCNFFDGFFFFWANTHQIDLTKEGRTINQEEEKVQEYFGIQVIQN